MSASERLRTLDGAMPQAPWFYEAGIPQGGDRTGSVWRREPLQLVMSKPHVSTAQKLLALRNALPLIADVVEAAEDTFDEYPDRFAALTALREHLEGGDEGRGTAYGPGQPGWADYGGPGYVEGGDE